MSHDTDLLEAVRAELVRLTGNIPTIAREAAVGYDTCLRIKNGEGDPAYGNVRRLAEYLRIESRVGFRDGARLEPAPALAPMRVA